MINDFWIDELIKLQIVDTSKLIILLIYSSIFLKT